MSLRGYSSAGYRDPGGRLRALRLTLIVLIALGAIAGGGLLGRWFFATRSFAWQVRRGLDMLGQADPSQLRERLDRWEAETAAAWEPRLDAFIDYLYSQKPWADPRLRVLMARVSGADYGAREGDWERWYKGAKRLRDGELPKVPGAEAVRLRPRWEAAVGLTAWYTTILPLDGQIYVASLGESFDAAEDPADGVVRVDGGSGAVDLVFSPPERTGRGPRDVLGIAATEDGLFVACRNGTVYRTDYDGNVSWEQHAGSPVVSAPVSVDINNDGANDVLVITRDAKVVAISGSTGRNIWVSSLVRGPGSADMLGATLALGDVLPGGGLELIATTPPGAIDVMTLKSGTSRWRHTLESGALSGGMCLGTGNEQGLPLFTGDGGATVWSFNTAGRLFQPVPWAFLGLRTGDTLIGGVRTVRNNAEGPPLLVACPTGEFAAKRGGVCMIGADGVQWRVPIPGAIWGTPAVADLNADQRSEILVTSIEVDREGRPCGVLTVISGPETVIAGQDARPDGPTLGGHIVQRIVFGAPVECSPVVSDVDGDGFLEVLVADQDGILHCFGTNRYGAVRWGLVGGDTHNTRNAMNAFSFGQRVFGYQRFWTPEAE